MEERTEEIRVTLEREAVDVHLEVVVQVDRPAEFGTTHRDDGGTDTDLLELRDQVSREFRRYRVCVGRNCLDSY
jgi:hypothetical protein